MMNVFIDKLERLMNEFKNESVNPNEDEAKRQSLIPLSLIHISEPTRH